MVEIDHSNNKYGRWSDRIVEITETDYDKQLGEPEKITSNKWDYFIITCVFALVIFLLYYHVISMKLIAMQNLISTIKIVVGVLMSIILIIVIIANIITRKHFRDTR